MLPQGSVFSQASLQDYVDCPRRFELRYLERVAWPTPIAQEAVEAERHLQRGADFHRLVHQHLLGVSHDALAARIDDALLVAWWNAYLRHGPNLPGSCHAEAALSTSVEDCRLLAKLDLVASSPGEHLTIVDWKTNRRRPRRGWLEGRMQTKVYRFVLVEAGAQFNAGDAVDAATVEMIYWFAQFPAQPERFGYDAGLHAEDRTCLSDLITEIQERTSEGRLPKTEGQKTCVYCLYKTLCDRNVEPGDLDSLDDESDEISLDFDLDLEQVAEVEF